MMARVTQRETASIERPISATLKRGTIMDDKTLRLLIINQLDFEPSIDAVHIGVASKAASSRGPCERARPSGRPARATYAK